jgi:2-C-methyl-D-erythritol 4-phosphate cytidylyltransferase
VVVAGVLLAAGSGRRLGLDAPKALCLLGGLPLLTRAAAALRESSAIDQLVVVCPPGAAAHMGALLDSSVSGPAATIVEGAETRHGSLHRAIAVLDRRIETVVVHDACRPLAPADLVVRVLKAVVGGADVAVPVVQVTETVKELDPAGRIARTVPRETLVRVQTPQAVRRSVLAELHAGCSAAALLADEDGTLAPPDSRLVAVEGEDDAFPVIRPSDLSFAEAVLARRRAAG